MCEWVREWMHMNDFQLRVELESTKSLSQGTSYQHGILSHTSGGKMIHTLLFKLDSRYFHLLQVEFIETISSSKPFEVPFRLR